MSPAASKRMDSMSASSSATLGRADEDGETVQHLPASSVTSECESSEAEFSSGDESEILPEDMNFELFDGPDERPVLDFFSDVRRTLWKNYCEKNPHIESLPLETRRLLQAKSGPELRQIFRQFLAPFLFDFLACMSEAAPGSTVAAQTTDCPRRRTLEDDGTPLLACHFYKKNPEGNRSCETQAFVSFREVIGHLKTEHLFFEPLVCMGGPCGELSPGGHLWWCEVACKARSRGERMTFPATMSLGLAGVWHDADLSLEEQWYRVWDMLFPGETRPTTTNIGGDAVTAGQDGPRSPGQ